MKKVKMSLKNVKPSAFSILGEFAREARKQDWTRREVNAVVKAMATDFKNFMKTILDNITDGESDET